MKKGRYKLSDSRRKRCEIKARFKPDDYAAVLKKASHAGLKPSVFVARSALSAVIKEPLPKEVISHLKSLSRVGSNLNQIAAKINADPRSIYLSSLHDSLQKELGDLKAFRLILWEHIKTD